MTTPLDPDPTFSFSASNGMQVNRDLTKYFISNDPYTASLIPVVKEQQPSGGEKTISLPPRPAQAFKLIFQGMFESGVLETEAGQERKYDYILLGEWNATIHIGDYWEDADGGRYVVVGLSPYNGYEKKATVRYFGKEPLQHG